MRIVLFVHSIVSDWNNGHAHFLRGLVTALMERGHQVLCCEPADNWSSKNLFATAQAEPIVRFARRFPEIDVRFYNPQENPIEQVNALTAGADVVWIGNWGDDERADQIRDYLIGMAADLPGLQFMVYGVRYPKPVLRSFRKAGIRYRGWIANFDVPRVFAKARMTMHIMRSFYCTSLPGIPTIRPFEAMACGIPLITTRWFDAERLFDEGHDYLTAQSPEQMRQHIQRLTASERLRQEIAGNALQTIRSRHNCDVRAEQLEHICETITAQVA